MSELGQDRSKTNAKPRVLKAPAVRRAELIDCAQGLFLAKGYERTTINDVIAATGLSKGAFYHHFRAKEDLLEAIAARSGAQALAQVASPPGEDPAHPRADALRRLNTLLAMGRDWKGEHLPQLRAMFTTLLRPENGVLYHRITPAVLAAMAPAITDLLEQGRREGRFDLPDPALAAEVVLGLGEGRRALIIEAMTAAEAGDLDRAVEMITRRVRAEEALIDRVLGLPPGSVRLLGTTEELRALTAAWVGTPETTSGQA